MPSYVYVYDFRADDWTGDRKKFDGELQQLREQFDNQTKATWRTIAAAVKATFQVSSLCTISGQFTLHHFRSVYSALFLVSLLCTISSQFTLHYFWSVYSAPFQVSLLCAISGQFTLHHFWSV